jgi:hypothetical protein
MSFTYFCSPCRGNVDSRKKCEHWSMDYAVAGYFCPCGREGLYPGIDWHCLECHQDFPNRDAFYGHNHPAKVARAKAS